MKIFKKGTALLLAVALCLCACAALAMPGDHDVSYRYVKTGNGKSLNLRQEASPDAKVLTTVPYGAELIVYDYSKGDKWMHVIFNSYEGFVMSRYTDSAKPTEREQETALDSAQYKTMKQVSYRATVRPSAPSGYVHMRWAPSKTEPVIRNYYQNAVLKVIAENHTWCQVYDEANGVCGFMMKRFLN